ncbi:hypothetical protein A2U01_0013303 [Trifolium medium]|uniref:Uncharacterized protein n=1 Tax=Trifolium medium TaxID=97028 RepID=A0A392MZH2_9FABA|nr:hypothetical protein [Trifolium medium]
MAITKDGEEPNKVPSEPRFHEGKNGETVPDMEFPQTHKFHKDNFLDTESFACSRESRKVKNEENLPITEFFQTQDIYEDSFLATVFPETNCSSSSTSSQC